MEILRGIGHGEANGNYIEKGFFLKVGTDVEADFVLPFLKRTGRDERRIGATVGVGGVSGKQLSLKEELDLEVRGRFSGSSIEDMGAEFSVHPITSSNRSLAIFAISSSAVVISAARVWAKRWGKVARMASFLLSRAQRIKGKPNFFR